MNVCCQRVYNWFPASAATQDDPMQQSTTYRNRSRELLANARAELDTDLAQAGEKGWGAAASIVKAIAEQRSRYHRGHRALYEIVDALVRETGDEDLRRRFDSANVLHHNFYENWFDRYNVEVRLEDVEKFVGSVEILLNSSPQPD